MGCIISKDDNLFNNNTLFNTKELNFKDNILTARVVDIYDGDTITCILYVFKNHYKFKIRLAEIDTDEMTSKEENISLEAKGRLYNLITNEKMLIDKKEVKKYLNENIFLVKLLCGDFEKYGRLLAYVFNKNYIFNGDILNHNYESFVENNKLNSFNYCLINEKLARYYTGGTK
jgi:endonuclease YncB( thermonuclease family)